MFSFRTSPLLAQEDHLLQKGRLGVLCNHTAWDPQLGEYLFESLAKRGNLGRVFSPDGDFPGHGEAFARMREKGVEFTLFPYSPEQIEDLDAIIIEMQDTGCRYSACPAIVMNLFGLLEENGLQLPVYIVDRINPAGRRVEGTALMGGYRSYIGIEGIPHRYGMTIGELSYYLHNRIGAKFPLHIISYRASAVNRELMPWSIPPTLDFSGLFSASFYSGGVLWNGTNVSSKNACSRPYEMFGAPFMSVLEGRRPPEDEGVYMRWTNFLPETGNCAGERCFGYQLLLKPGCQYNSLAHTLRIMNFVRENCDGFRFSPDTPDPNSERTTIELLLGDKVLTDYVNGNEEWEEVREHIKVEEQKWIKKTKKMLLYEDEPLFRVK